MLSDIELQGQTVTRTVTIYGWVCICCLEPTFLSPHSRSPSRRVSCVGRGPRALPTACLDLASYSALAQKSLLQTCKSFASGRLVHYADKEMFHDTSTLFPRPPSDLPSCDFPSARISRRLLTEKVFTKLKDASNDLHLHPVTHLVQWLPCSPARALVVQGGFDDSLRISCHL
jgi:hypothetical protein